MAERISPELVSGLNAFNNLAFSRQWKQASEFAQQVLDSRQEDSMFWVGVLNAGQVAMDNGSSADANVEGTKLQRIGLLGLLRNFDANSIEDFLARSNVQLNNKNAEDLWIESLIALRSSVDNRQSLKVADSKIKRALELARRKNFDAIDQVRMEYLQASIKFRMGDFETALDAIPDSPLNITNKDEKLAEQILWLRCQCLIQISRKDKRKAPLAIATLNHLLANFPLTELKARIEYSKTIVANRLVSPEQAIADLKDISESNPFYIDAQLEMIKHRLQIFQSARNAADRSQTFDEIVRLDYAFRKRYPEENERCLQSLFLVIEACVGMNSGVHVLDEKIRIAVEIVGKNEVELAQFEPRLMHYRFLASRSADRVEQALEIARWLFRNSGDRRSEIAALSYLAEKSKGLPRNEITEIYENLSERLGNSEADLVASTNARVAAARLVDLFIEAQQWKNADSINQKLLKTNPSQQQYIYQAAIIAKKLGQTERASRHWNQLARGATDGSDLWLESKFELIKNMRDSSNHQALKLLTQTRALAGEMSDHWSRKYNQLESEIQTSLTDSPSSANHQPE